MRIGSTFSGTGALELGLERAGVGDVVWQVEHDASASKVLAAHWPNVPNLGDITAVDWSSVEPIDVLVGGPPCQAVSVAGKRKGPEDERWLWPYWLEAVGVLRPRVVVAENPPGVAPWLGDIVSELARRGFVGRIHRLRASDIGACHRRERWFLVATDARSVGRDGNPCLCGVGRHKAVRGEAFDSVGVGVASQSADTSGDQGWVCDGDSSSPADPDSEQLRVRTGGLAGETGGLQGEGDQRERIRVDARDGGPTVADTDGGGCEVCTQLDSDTAHDPADRGSCGQHVDGCSGAATPNAENFGRDGRRDSRDWRNGPENDRETPALSDCLGRERTIPEPFGDDSRSDSGADFGPYTPAILRWGGVLGRHAPDPVDDRGRLNPVFVEWMLGAPAGWVTDVDISWSAQLKCLGNSVQVQCAEVVGVWVCEALAGT